MRTQQQIRDHYEIEKVLAERLMKSSKEERGALYTEVYDELFRRVPHHPQLTRKQSERDSRRHVARVKPLVSKFLNDDSVFLEVGAGDLSLCTAVAEDVDTVYAIDVSTEITKRITPPNCHVVISDGTSIPVPAESVSLVFSDQLMEHVHPDDAIEQLGNIYECLHPGGRYLCITPNKVNGPHDISRHFDDVATGFHLREYSYKDLDELFRNTGFDRVSAILRLRKLNFTIPVGLMIGLERIAAFLPKSVLKTRPMRYLIGTVAVVGMKSKSGRASAATESASEKNSTDG